MRLYRNGQSDMEIGRRMNVSGHTVGKWRAKSRLKCVRPGLGRPTEAQKVERLSLYEAGMTDKEIADRTGSTSASIRTWRSVRNLSPNGSKRLTDAEHETRMALHKSGLNDREIAAQVGCGVSVINAWRRRKNLPSHNPLKRNLTSKHHSARLMLYEQGKNDCEIARDQNVRPRVVQAWRERAGLPARKRSYRPRKLGDPVLDRIRSAVGRALPPDLADDAVSELYLAALEGKVTLDRIEAEARSFAKRVQNSFANSFRTRSVDEALAGTEDLLMIDTLVDEAAEDWLEEMGASVSHLE